MLISIPSTLSVSGLSDVSHITDIYTQLTDGSRELTANACACTNLICTNFKNSSSTGRFWLHQIQQTGILIGDQSENIDIILNTNNFYAKEYPDQWMYFNGEYYSTNYTYFTCDVISAKNISNVWEWQLIGINEWN